MGLFSRYPSSNAIWHMAERTLRVARMVICEASSAGRTLISRLKNVSRLTSLDAGTPGCR